MNGIMALRLLGNMVHGVFMIGNKKTFTFDILSSLIGTEIQVVGGQMRYGSAVLVLQPGIGTCADGVTPRSTLTSRLGAATRAASRLNRVATMVYC